MHYKYLASPVNIGTMRLKNRTVMTAITMQYAEEGPDGGYMNERLKHFYFERAAGGVALIIAGGVATDQYVGYKNMLRLSDDKYIPGFRELAEGIHERGSLLCVQLLQTGRYGRAEAVYGDDSILSASAVPSTFSPDVPREMTKAEIQMVIQNAADAAVRAKEAGCDAVEICANSGYMICQFLSPLTNQRTDEYGGDFENRCRFGMEMIAAVRKAVGNDYPLLLRVAGNDFVKGGNKTEECIIFCKKAQEAGIDAIDVTGGWHETVIPQLPAEVPRGGFVYLAEQIKREVSVPVISSNRHNDPMEAERVLATGQADLIGQCRTLLADPQWPDKVLNGKEREIRKCLACNQGCFAKVFHYEPCECLFNSYVGREADEWKIKPAREAKKLLVVGAGPAGCEFAYRAAARGHHVTIWERDENIGGQAQIAALPPAKEEFRNIAEFHESMLAKYGVRTELGREATAEDILAAGFDEVIVATGANARRIPLENTGQIPVYTAEEILTKSAVAGKHVVVIGGGSVGCETADYLAHEASLSAEKLYFLLSQNAESTEKIKGLLNHCSREITITDVARIGGNYEFGCGWPILKDLRRLGVAMYSKSRILEIGETEVMLEITDRKTAEKQNISVPCDTIVLAVGYQPEDALFKTLKEKGVVVHNIGDSAKVSKVSDAIRAADDLAAEI